MPVFKVDIEPPHKKPFLCILLTGSGACSAEAEVGPGCCPEQYFDMSDKPRLRAPAGCPLRGGIVTIMQAKK